MSATKSILNQPKSSKQILYGVQVFRMWHNTSSPDYEENALDQYFPKPIISVLRVHFWHMSILHVFCNLNFYQCALKQTTLEMTSRAVISDHTLWPPVPRQVKIPTSLFLTPSTLVKGSTSKQRDKYRFSPYGPKIDFLIKWRCSRTCVYWLNMGP